MPGVACSTETLERVHFGAIEVSFNGDVLRPRSWTTIQANWAADVAREVPAGPIVELCCGAGQIGLLAAVRSGRRLVQVDSDPSACRFARLNAARAGVLNRVETRCGDIASALGLSERFPLIIADPPYVPSAEIGRFPDDPPEAIDGGQDGLDAIRQCLDVVTRHLLQDGACLLQVRGPSQVARLGSIVDRRSLVVHDARVVDDDRAVVLLRREREQS